MCSEASSFAGFVSIETYSYDSESTTLAEAVSERHRPWVDIIHTIASSTTGEVSNVLT